MFVAAFQRDYREYNQSELVRLSGMKLNSSDRFQSQFSLAAAKRSSFDEGVEVARDASHKFSSPLHQTKETPLSSRLSILSLVRSRKKKEQKKRRRRNGSKRMQTRERFEGEEAFALDPSTFLATKNRSRDSMRRALIL